MTASELIATLRRKGVLLRADGDDLKVSAPRGGLSDAELAQPVRSAPFSIATPS